MKKETKALSGASQDAYFRRVLKAHPHLSAAERDRIVRQLREEVAQLRLRVKGHGDIAVSAAPPATPAAQPTAAIPQATAASAFDPYSPNVVVVVRKSGREAALAALAAIDSAENLRLLAREQRLNVDADLSSAAEMRTAIVMAAERRIANRVAAAG